MHEQRLKEYSTATFSKIQTDFNNNLFIIKKTKELSMLATTSAQQKKVPIIYYVDDWNNSLSMARAFFKNKGVIFREFHDLSSVYWECQKRKPTLVLITTYLNDPEQYVFSHRMGFPALNVLHSTYKDIKIITLGKEDRKDDDLIDSMREGALGHYLWAMDTMEYLLARAWMLLESENEPGGTENELAFEERVLREGEEQVADIAPAQKLSPDMEQMKTLIYSVVRQAMEDMFTGKNAPPPPNTPQRIAAYPFN